MKRFFVLALCVAAAWHAPGLITRGRADGPAPTLAVATARPPATARKARLGSVSVDLLGVESSQGQLLAALFRDQRNFPGGGDKAFARRVQKARAGTMRLTFENIPEGPYAITVHHDEDGDFELDTGLFGIPTEGYGFSRNAHAPFGPPSFDDSKLVMTPGQQQHLRIRLRY